MADPLAPAARALAQGRLVVYPTDTLYGLGVRATDPDAVATLVAVKRRPAGQPISVAVSSTEELEGIADLSEAGRRFVRRALPGAYTVIVRCRAGGPLAGSLRASDGTVGVRIPDHPVARELARRAGPITATSANRHGETPGGTPAEIRRSLGGDVAVYLREGPAPRGTPSQLVDLTGPRPRILPRSPARRTR